MQRAILWSYWRQLVLKISLWRFIEVIIVMCFHRNEQIYVVHFMNFLLLPSINIHKHQLMNLAPTELLIIFSSDVTTFCSGPCMTLLTSMLTSRDSCIIHGNIDFISCLSLCQLNQGVLHRKPLFRTWYIIYMIQTSIPLLPKK